MPIQFAKTFRPARIPAPTMALLREAAAKALKDPGVESRQQGAGVEVTPMALDANELFMEADYDRWTGFIRQAAITVG